MENFDKLVEAFSAALNINKEDVNNKTSYGDGSWDSVAHMAIIAAIEDAFRIEMDTEDIIDLSSFSKAKDIITKYGIIF